MVSYVTIELTGFKKKVHLWEEDIKVLGPFLPFSLRNGDPMLAKVCAATIHSHPPAGETLYWLRPGLSWENLSPKEFGDLHFWVFGYIHNVGMSTNINFLYI